MLSVNVVDGSDGWYGGDGGDDKEEDDEHKCNEDDDINRVKTFVWKEFLLLEADLHKLRRTKDMIF